jgi:hypothetical protein
MGSGDYGFDGAIGQLCVTHNQNLTGFFVLETDERLFRMHKPRIPACRGSTKGMGAAFIHHLGYLRWLRRTTESGRFITVAT